MLRRVLALPCHLNQPEPQLSWIIRNLPLLQELQKIKQYFVFSFLYPLSVIVSVSSIRIEKQANSPKN